MSIEYLPSWYDDWRTREPDEEKCLRCFQEEYCCICKDGPLLEDE